MLAAAPWLGGTLLWAHSLDVPSILAQLWWREGEATCSHLDRWEAEMGRAIRPCPRKPLLPAGLCLLRVSASQDWYKHVGMLVRVPIQVRVCRALDSDATQAIGEARADRAGERPPLTHLSPQSSRSFRSCLPVPLTRVAAESLLFSCGEQWRRQR